MLDFDGRIEMANPAALRLRAVDAESGEAETSRRFGRVLAANWRRWRTARRMSRPSGAGLVIGTAHDPRGPLEGSRRVAATTPGRCSSAGRVPAPGPTRAPCASPPRSTACSSTALPHSTGRSVRRDAGSAGLGGSVRPRVTRERSSSSHRPRNARGNGDRSTARRSARQSTCSRRARTCRNSRPKSQ